VGICHYSINRRSSNVRRTRFTPEEVVALTLDSYKRNYIEGLFLSSGIVRSADFTMEQVVQVAKTLRRMCSAPSYTFPFLISSTAWFAARAVMAM